MDNKTGGSAFPRNILDHESGMTLRDWFAGLAMQSLLTVLEKGKEHQAALIPRTSYDIADAMLKAREAK